MFNASRGLLCNCETSSSTRYSHSAGVKLCPGGDELAQVVGAEDGGVPGEVVEVVHDDGHEEVDHDEAAEEDEADEVEVGGVAAAALLGVEQLAGGVVARVALLVARPPALARQHDVRPRLARRAPAARPGDYCEQTGIIASRRMIIAIRRTIIASNR